MQLHEGDRANEQSMLREDSYPGCPGKVGRAGGPVRKVRRGEANVDELFATLTQPPSAVKIVRGRQVPYKGGTCEG
jgi:hypothetical protein